MPKGHIILVATLDSKGVEAEYLKGRLEGLGRSVRVVDIGTAGTPKFSGDVTREEIAQQAGISGQMAVPADALDAMARGSADIVGGMFDRREIAAIVGIGGGKGASAFHRITSDLPYGFPKILVTSARPALLAEIATTSDTILLPTLVDLFGLNQFTRAVLDNAADMVGGLEWNPVAVQKSKTIAITAFGVTTPAVQSIKLHLESADVTVIAFPANGAGGRTMESLIAKRAFDGVIDLTTTEIADLLLGGTASAGENRLTAAGILGIPQLIAPGAIDMVNFGPPEMVPDRFSDRITCRHTRMTTLVRTTPEETAEIAVQTAKRLNRAQGPVAVFWPAGGVSDYDRPGNRFHNPDANAAWRDEIKQNLKSGIPVMETDHHINDPEFAALCADWMIAQLDEAS